MNMRKADKQVAPLGIIVADSICVMMCGAMAPHFA